MAYFLPNATNGNFSAGLDQMFVYINSQVPYFIPAALLCLWSIIFFGGYFLEKATAGRGAVITWALTASIFIFIITAALGMIGLAPASLIVIWGSVTGLLIALFFMIP